MNEQDLGNRWFHLYCLTILAEQGSFTRAAQRLKISKAAMSKKIAELEKAAGVPLVHRTTRNTYLTEAAQELVDAIHGSFVQIEDGFSRVKEQSEVPSGVIRVTAPSAFARQKLMPIIPAFLKLYPHIRIELDISDAIKSLAKDGLDLAIRHTETVPDTHMAWEIARTRSVLVASPAYLEARGTPQEPDDLRHHQCLFYPREHAMPTWAFQKSSAKKSPRPDARTTVQIGGLFAANNSEALREAALAGLGIALVPGFSVEQSLANGQLRSVLDDWRPIGSFANSIYAVRPYSPRTPMSIRLFIEFLRERLG